MADHLTIFELGVDEGKIREFLRPAVYKNKHNCIIAARQGSIL